MLLFYKYFASLLIFEGMRLRLSVYLSVYLSTYLLICLIVCPLSMEGWNKGSVKNLMEWGLKILVFKARNQKIHNGRVNLISIFTWDDTSFDFLSKEFLIFLISRLFRLYFSRQATIIDNVKFLIRKRRDMYTGYGMRG